jgi:hypothetical protein
LFKLIILNAKVGFFFQLTKRKRPLIADFANFETEIADFETEIADFESRIVNFNSRQTNS